MTFLRTALVGRSAAHTQAGRSVRLAIAMASGPPPPTTMSMGRPASADAPLAFAVLAEIAFGVTARVDLARVLPPHPKAGQLVAVKRLHAHLAGEPMFATEFLDEVWMTASLRHPNVVEVVGWGTDEAGAYMAVELVQGVSLARLMKTIFETGEVFTERMVVFIARCICRGLAAAHALRSSAGEPLHLVHRDLSPGNILVGFDGQVKIADFGVAKAKQRLTKTMPGIAKGDVAYMAPEQARGEDVDGLADVFSLGVLLFEILSGKRPWKVKTILDLIDKTSTTPPLDLLELRPKLHKELWAVVSRCLERDRTKRYQSAGEIEKKLGEWLLLHGYTEENEEALARFVRRNAMRQMRWFERAVSGGFAAQGTLPEAGDDSQPASVDALAEGADAASGPASGLVQARHVERTAARTRVEGPLQLRGRALATSAPTGAIPSLVPSDEENVPTIIHDRGPAVPSPDASPTNQGPALAGGAESPDPAPDPEFDLATVPVRVEELRAPTFRAALARQPQVQRPPLSNPVPDESSDSTAPGRRHISEDVLLAEAERLTILAARRREDAEAAARLAVRRGRIADMAAEAAEIAAHAIEILPTAGLAVAAARLEAARRIEADLENNRLRVVRLAPPPPLTSPLHQPPAPLLPQPPVADPSTDRGLSRPRHRDARLATLAILAVVAAALVILVFLVGRFARLI